MRTHVSSIVVGAVAALALVACDNGSPSSSPPAEAAGSASNPSEVSQPAADMTVEPAQPLPPGEPSAPKASATKTPEPVPPASPPPSTQPTDAAAPLPPPLRPAAFARCQACHSTDPSDGHGVGPNLAGIVGARVGAQAGFNYSAAMSASGQIWTPEFLDEFLQNPRETIPGTKMVAAPMRDARSRREIIEYLSGH